MGQRMRQGDERCTILGWRLQLLWHISRALPNLRDVFWCEGQAIHLYRTLGNGNESQYRSQKRGLTTSTLAADTDKLASVYDEIEAAKQGAVAISEGEGFEN